jgi:hypothetical protein
LIETARFETRDQTARLKGDARARSRSRRESRIVTAFSTGAFDRRAADFQSTGAIHSSILSPGVRCAPSQRRLRVRGGARESRVAKFGFFRVRETYVDPTV